MSDNVTAAASLYLVSKHWNLKNVSARYGVTVAEVKEALKTLKRTETARLTGYVALASYPLRGDQVMVATSLVKDGMNLNKAIEAAAILVP